MTDEALLERLDRFDDNLTRQRRRRLRVCCASQEFDSEEMSFGAGRWLSCSRGIWELFYLSTEPDLVIIMLQAPPLPSGVTDYVVHLTGQTELERADHRRRHLMIEISDMRDVHLSQKVLDRPWLIERLRTTLRRARDRGHTIEGLSGYAGGFRMAKLARLLGIPLREADPEMLQWGTKSGSRVIFRESGVYHPPGTYRPMYSTVAIAEAVDHLARRHDALHWIVKIDRGFGSSHGNAYLEVPLDHDRSTLSRLLPQLIRPFTPSVTNDAFVDMIERHGAVVELDVGRDSPTRAASSLSLLAQHRPTFRATLLATHEQTQDSSNGFLGAVFPASDDYRAQIISATDRITAALIARRVRGHVGVDFLAERAPEGWKLWALEINLRQTGTTHGHHAIRALVDAQWPPIGTLVARDGTCRVYSTTDSLISHEYVGLKARDVIAGIEQDPLLALDRVAGRGLVAHHWSALAPHGKIGATSVGRTMDECAEIEARFRRLLARLSRARLDQ